MSKEFFKISKQMYYFHFHSLDKDKFIWGDLNALQEGS